MVSRGKEMPVLRPYSTRIAVIFGLAMACGFAVVLCVGLSIRLGQNLPVVDVSYDYVVALVVAVILGALILLWPLQPLERKVCLSLWLLKMFMTLVVMLWYESHYEILDSFGYFRDSLQPSRDFTVLNLAVGTEIMSRFFSRLWLVMPESYHAAKVVCAYFGLAAFVMFGRAFELITSRPRVHFLLVIGVFPSMLFWSSIAGKDPLILFGIAGATYAVASWYQEGGRWPHLVMFILASLATSLIRPWIGAMLVTSFLFATVAQFVWRQFGVWGAALIALAGSACAALVLVALSSQMGGLLLALEATSNAFAGGGSGVNAPLTFGSWKDVLVFLPLGVFTALFRPLPGEVGNAFGLLAGLENVLLIMLTVGTAWWVFTGRSGRAWRGRPVVLWILLTVAMWAGLYAFLSYQNLGTGVRFKAQILPLLFLLYAAASIGPRVSADTRDFPRLRGAAQ
jgi:hypothetical protein